MASGTTSLEPVNVTLATKRRGLVLALYVWAALALVTVSLALSLRHRLVRARLVHHWLGTALETNVVEVESDAHADSVLKVQVAGRDDANPRELVQLPYTFSSMTAMSR